MTPTNDRQEVLYFTDPYYYTPAVALVHEDNTSVADLTTDLDGKKIGVCSGCTYEQFLDGSLAIEGFEFDFVVDDAEISGYDTDTTALQDLALGDGDRLDAAMTSVTTAQGFIDSDKPVKIVGDPLFYEPLGVAFDKSSELDGQSLVDAVNEIVAEMHEDGTLTEMSEEWYDGIDLTVAAVTVTPTEPDDGGWRERLALASARVPFRLKVAVGLGLRLPRHRDVPGLRPVRPGVDARQGRVHRQGSPVDDLHGGRRHRAGVHAGLSGCAGPDLEQPGGLRHRRLLHLVLPGHSPDRADVPDLPGAAAVRVRGPGPVPRAFRGSSSRHSPSTRRSPASSRSA